jgi:hypothetical protein
VDQFELFDPPCTCLASAEVLPPIGDPLAEAKAILLVEQRHAQMPFSSSIRPQSLDAVAPVILIRRPRPAGNRLKGEATAWFESAVPSQLSLMVCPPSQLEALFYEPGWNPGISDAFGEEPECAESDIERHRADFDGPEVECLLEGRDVDTLGGVEDADMVPKEP